MGGNDYGNPISHPCRIEKLPEAVVLRRNVTIGSLWPGRGIQGSKYSLFNCPPFHLPLVRSVTPVGQIHLETRGPGNPLMEIFKSRIESILTLEIPW